MTTNLPFLRWLVAHPLVRAGRDDDGVPDREPAALGAAAAARRTRRGAAPGGSTCPLRRPVPRLTSTRPRARTAPRVEQSTITAPMPGTVIKVLVEAGATVSARQPLVVLEAMKMETPLVSPYDATVRAVYVSGGRPGRRRRRDRRARGIAASGRLRKFLELHRARPCRP